MTRFDDVNELLLKRAIIYPNSEIHGNLAGFLDYGSVGSEIKLRWEELWRKHFLSLNENFHEVQNTLLMPKQVFKASGHLEHFNDPIAECTNCDFSARADHILEDVLGEKFEGLTPEEYNDLIKKHKIVCTKCKKPLKDIQSFSLMFKMEAGAGDRKSEVYLRPETAQGPFVSFKREFRANREKLPLGLATIGKAFRNEIAPRQGVIRTREFTQAELQIFFDPNNLPEVPFKEIENYELRLLFSGEKEIKKVKCKDAVKSTGMDKFFIYFMAQDQKFVESLGLLKHFRFAELNEKEKAFYNKYHWDLELFLPSLDKWTEIAGFHYRTDHDLGGHNKLANDKLEVSSEGKKIIPHVLELSWGVDRNIFALLDLTFTQEEKRTYFALPKQVSPFDAGVFPLVKKGGLPEKAKKVYELLNKDFKVFTDSSGSIGRRYARADEVGVALCLTVDFDSLEDDSVTVRERDSTKQHRVKIKDLNNWMQNYFK